MHVFGLSGVRLVSDAYDIPGALPLPILPDLAFLPQVTMTGIAVGIVGLLLGAGVSHTFPNRDGRYPDISAEFRGMGVDTIAFSLLWDILLACSLDHSTVPCTP